MGQIQYFFKVLKTDFTIQYFQYRVGSLKITFTPHRGSASTVCEREGSGVLVEVCQLGRGFVRAEISPQLPGQVEHAVVTRVNTLSAPKLNLRKGKLFQPQVRQKRSPFKQLQILATPTWLEATFKWKCSTFRIQL